MPTRAKAARVLLSMICGVTVMGTAASGASLSNAPPSLPKGYHPGTTEDLRNVTERDHELSELAVARGMIHFNAERYIEAETSFKEALGNDPRNFLAMEYLALIQEQRADLKSAIAWLVKAKHRAPEARWPVLNFQIGRLYYFQKNVERAEIYLKLAVDQNVHEVSANYLLGYLYYTQERYLEAERYLHQAKVRAQSHSASGTERAMLQPVNYYLGEAYARLGFVRYSIAILRQCEYGESWELRSTAWKVHSELNKPLFSASLGVFGQYDSNVILLPIDTALPVEYTSEGAIGSVLMGAASAQTSPAKRWIFGVEGNGYLNNRLNGSLARFDVLSLGGAGWVNYWNQKDWSLVARYELEHVWLNRNAFESFQSAHGPVVSAVYAPFQRWNWEAGAQLRINSFANDLLTGADRRSGVAYVPFLRASLKAPNPRFRPTLTYQYEQDEADGVNFQSRAHVLSADALWRAWEKTHLSLGFGLRFTGFPNHLAGRDDQTSVYRAGLNHILNLNWMLIFDVVRVHNGSSLPDFSYDRTTLTAGATYTF
ncbi:MAG: tetratricopeptide repeat protein [Bdellovibrionota bacterium]